MNAIRMNKTNRFWQECQRFDFAQKNEMKHEIQTDPSPQAGGSAV
jgi:hypothetical protein